VLGVALGICLATAFGLVLGNELAETLLCVGAFFGGLGSLIPHERHRIVVAWASAAMFTIAASVGAALHSVWPAVYVVLFAGMFASGLLRAVSIGLGVRLLFASIVMLIVAETVPAVATAGEVVGWLGLGAAISAACQLVPPYGPRHGAQRRAVSGLYGGLSSNHPGMRGIFLLIEAARQERFGVPVMEGYGLSETSPIAVSNRMDLARRPGFVGQPV
jgi:hypothetical protein